VFFDNSGRLHPFSAEADNQRNAQIECDEAIFNKNGYKKKYSLNKKNNPVKYLTTHNFCYRGNRLFEMSDKLVFTSKIDCNINTKTKAD
jgi:hypothetical protein